MWLCLTSGDGICMEFGGVAVLLSGATLDRPSCCNDARSSRLLPRAQRRASDIHMFAIKKNYRDEFAE